MLKSKHIAITSYRTSYYDPKYMLETKNELKPTQFLVRENWDLFSAPTRSANVTNVTYVVKYFLGQLLTPLALRDGTQGKAIAKFRKVPQGAVALMMDTYFMWVIFA